MQVIETKIADLFLIKPRVFKDARGWFMESWSKQKFEMVGLYYDFVQDNHAYSNVKGTLRGLHFQKGSASQAKLVRCTKGRVLDVAVDLRRDSKTYLQHVAVELSEENFMQFLIPKGFAHGYLTLTEQVEFLYKTDQFYNPEAEYSIRFNDPVLAIDWKVEKPILAEKDKLAPFLSEIDPGF